MEIGLLLGKNPIFNSRYFNSILFYFNIFKLKYIRPVRSFNNMI